MASPSQKRLVQKRLADIREAKNARFKWPKWTGFSGKTLWDLLNLLAALAIPIAIAIGTTWFSYQQNQTSMQIAADQQQEATLKSYLDDMSDLLLNHNLRNSKPADEVRQVARERTLTTLRQLNANRNRIVLQFLRDANLIGMGKSVIDLCNANLSNDDLSGVDLSGVDLRGSNLQGAGFTGANLSFADLSCLFCPGPQEVSTNLEGAHLEYADLRGADLFFALLGGADLSYADLGGAHLQGAGLTGANLSFADLSCSDLRANGKLICSNLDGAHLKNANLHNAYLNGANLTDADLEGADLSAAYLDAANLSFADLKGAKVTNEQLAKTNSLQHATLPDGSEHP